ncbi:MAG: GNAT family N-acetyltransferase [Haloferacaceae archaeon]
MFPPAITTPRLDLRRANEALDPLDHHEYFGATETIVEETRYVSWHPHETLRETEAALESFESAWEDAESATYAIFPREGEEGAGTLAGTTALNLDWDRRSASLEIWLRKPFWGRRYAGERAGALYDLAFDRLDLDLVSVFHHVDNEKSRSAVNRYVERFGGHCEGRLRNAIDTANGPADVYRYSVTQDEWRDAVAEDPLEVTYP